MLDIFKQSGNISSNELDDLIIVVNTGLNIVKVCLVFD